MQCRQAKLKSDNRHQISWIDSSVKEGDSVQFKNDPRWWLVEKVYHPILDKGDIKHGWKVGGLT